MKKIIFIFLLLGLFSLSAFAQSGSDSTVATVKTVPANFKSDGCTLFPVGCFRECCVEHDKAYFVGGTGKERRQADILLFKCVSKKKGWWHKVVASLMYVGVRIGGVAFLPTPFRWGFGQKKSKKSSKPKTEDSKKKADVSRSPGSSPPTDKKLLN